MPGQPSPSASSTSSMGSMLEEEYPHECDTECRSMSSLDSLGTESCDDPSDTMQIPDAVVLSPSFTSSDSPPRCVEETDGSAEHNGTDPFDENTANTGSEDEIGEKWDPSLYMLQSQAPKPVCIACTKEWASYPSQYGPEYHGVIDKHKAAELIGSQNGGYLVRETPKGARILTFMLDERLYNFKLFFEDGQHYVGEKRFESIDDMVQDGLITLYLQKHDVVDVMEKGRRCSTLARKNTEQRLKRKDGKRVRGLKGKAAWSYSRSASGSSVSSIDVQPPSSTGNSLSPNLSRSPSPVPILNVEDPGSMRNKSMSPEMPCLNMKLDLDMEQSCSAPPTPLLPEDHSLAPSNREDESSLDFSSSNQRRSTPNLLGNTVQQSQSLVTHRNTPLGERRVKSASTLQRSGVSQKQRRTAIINTLKLAVQEDKQNKVEPEIKKSATLGSTAKSNYKRFSDRCNSCSAAVAHTLDRLADYSVKGPTTLSRSSLAALARHTSGPRSPYTKAHNFEMHTYISPTWCEICHNYLWGLKQQGMQCKDCGMDIHKQCLPLAIQLQCFPNKTFVKRVYGVDLTTLVKMEGGVVPKILSECIEEIQSRGMTSQGIYRVSGHSTEIIELKEKYNEGVQVDFSQYSDENIITGAIKLYLRELPIPLITYDVYKNIIKATAGISDPENEDTDWQPLINALLLLPKAHYNTLKHLAQHLNNVDSHSDENKMTARNLSTVFAPTLMRSPSQDSDDLTVIKNLPLQKAFVEYLILYHSTLFRS